MTGNGAPVLDLIRRQFAGRLTGQLGLVVGLPPDTVQRAMQSLLPLHLEALADPAQAPGGAGAA